MEKIKNKKTNHTDEKPTVLFDRHFSPLWTRLWKGPFARMQEEGLDAA